MAKYVSPRSTRMARKCMGRAWTLLTWNMETTVADNQWKRTRDAHELTLDWQDDVEERGDGDGFYWQKLPRGPVQQLVWQSEAILRRYTCVTVQTVIWKGCWRFKYWRQLDGITIAFVREKQWCGKSKSSCKFWKHDAM